MPSLKSEVLRGVLWTRSVSRSWRVRDDYSGLRWAGQAHDDWKRRGVSIRDVAGWHVSPMRREVAYADTEGRFLIRVPVDKTWPLTVSDTGFHAVTQQVSGSVAELIVFRLAHAGTTGLPDHERFGRGCRCPGDLFRHKGR